MNGHIPEARSVLITGAARGLGRAMTLALAKAGVGVGAIDLPDSAAEMASLMAEATSAGAGAHVAPLAGDITQPDDCARIVEEALERFGSVHGLVNNAGRGMQDIGAVLVGQRKKFFEVDVPVWRGVIDTNVNGPFVMARAIAPVLVAQGWGRIVNIVTSYTTMQAVGFSPYGPTKAALEAATVIWAKDLEGTGVTVNALLPGRAANTRMIPQSEAVDRANLVQPEAMGPPIVWLMSAAADGLTGRRFIAQGWQLAEGQRADDPDAFAPAGFKV